MNDKMEEIKKFICEMKGEDVTLTKGQILEEAVNYLYGLKDEVTVLKRQLEVAKEIKEPETKRFRPSPVSRSGSKED
jgi:hypothetical protein